MLVDKQEKLENGLKSIPLISDVEWINHDKFGFSRELKFSVRANTYEIIWWVNYSQLIINKELVLFFDELEYNGVYPNRFKNNLVFKYKKQDVLFLPVEEYDNLK